MKLSYIFLLIGVLLSIHANAMEHLKEEEQRQGNIKTLQDDSGKIKILSDDTGHGRLTNSAHQPVQVYAMEHLKEEDNSQASRRVTQLSVEQAKDIEKEKSSTHTPEDNSEERKCCYHWGIHRWVAGIGEYIVRTFCCGYGHDVKFTERMFTIVHNEKIIQSSDCFCFSYEIMTSCDAAVCFLVYCPCVALCHLGTFPFALSMPKKHQIVVKDQAEHLRQINAPSRRNAARGSGPHAGFGYYGGGDDGGSYSSGGGS